MTRARIRPIGILLLHLSEQRSLTQHFISRDPGCLLSLGDRYDLPLNCAIEFRQLDRAIVVGVRSFPILGDCPNKRCREGAARTQFQAVLTPFGGGNNGDRSLLAKKCSYGIIIASAVCRGP